MIADSLIYLKEYNEITAKNRNEKNFDTSDEEFAKEQYALCIKKRQQGASR